MSELNFFWSQTIGDRFWHTLFIIGNNNYCTRGYFTKVFIFFLFQALEKQGAEKAQQKAQEKSLMMNTMNKGYMSGQGVGRGMGVRGGRVGPIRGGAGYTPGHSRKPYDKPMHAVQQPSLSGPIGAKDFATYPEPLIGKLFIRNPIGLVFYVGAEELCRQQVSFMMFFAIRDHSRHEKSHVQVVS